MTMTLPMPGLDDLEMEKPGGNLGKSLGYMAWYHIAGAVIDVYRENQRLEETGKHLCPAGADEWAICSLLRNGLWTRCRACWARRTGHPPHHFPYNEDAVAKLYFRFRKRSEEEVNAFEREILLAEQQDKGRK